MGGKSEKPKRNVLFTGKGKCLVGKSIVGFAASARSRISNPPACMLMGARPRAKLIGRVMASSDYSYSALLII